MKFYEWVWLVAFLGIPGGLSWLSYEVRKLREKIAKPLSVTFTDTLRVKAESDS